MIQLECPASPFPAPDVILSSSAQASRAFSDVRMFFSSSMDKAFGVVLGGMIIFVWLW